MSTARPAPLETPTAPAPVPPDALAAVRGGSGTYKDLWDGAGNDGYLGSGRRRGQWR